MKNLILLTGLHRTGTSSVQIACAANLKALKDLGYSYPISIVPPGHAPSNHTFLISTHFSSLLRDSNGSIPLLSLSPNTQRLQLQEHLRNLLRDFDGNLILAAERISTLTTIELQDLKRFFCEIGFSIKVFCSIRAPTEWLNSMIAQRIAGARGPRLDLNSVMSEFLEQNSLIVHRLKNLQSTFSNACFYPFKKSVMHPQGVAGFFFELLNLNIPIHNFYINQSSSNHAVRLLSIINYAIRSREIDANPYQSPLISKLTKMPGAKFSLNTDELTPLNRMIQYENEWLSQTFGASFCDQLDSEKCLSEKLNEGERNYLNEAIETSSEVHICKIIRDYMRSC